MKYYLPENENNKRQDQQSYQDTDDDDPNRDSSNRFLWNRDRHLASTSKHELNTCIHPYKQVH